MNNKYYLLSLMGLPILIALVFNSNPILLYSISWIGHILILYISIFTYKQNDANVPIKERVMEPIIINQIIFASFSGLSTIFYFLNINGYYYFSPVDFFLADEDQIKKASECQLLYLIGHWGFITGIMLTDKPKKSPNWKVVSGSNPSIFLLFISGVSFVLYQVLIRISGLYQLALMFESLNLVASILALAMALAERNYLSLVIALTLFGINIFSALVSGWKEQLLIPFILLGFFLYQYYPRLVIIASPIIIFIYFVYIPTFNQVFRTMRWEKGEENQIALEVAINSTIEADKDEINLNNWSFLTNRLSEVNMLMKYTDYVPVFREYYNFEILKQSLINIIPRIFYKDKPITEALVMQRVLDAGVVSNISNVSAKPAFIADCYLSGGIWGVLIGTYILGSFIAWASSLCHEFFGGYTFGTALMYNSIFNELWRGNCFEFLASTMFWGIIVIYLVFRAARYYGLIVSQNQGKLE